MRFVDAGVSGGIWGLQVGYCMMVGGDDEAVALVEPAFRALAPEDGYAHIGPSGAGHFVKMVHNGIEYGLMQAYAEGFDIMQGSEFDLDLGEISGIWREGSVVRSWLLDLLHQALADRGNDLSGIAAVRRGLGRGPLDGLRGDCRRRAGSGDHALLSTRASRRGQKSRLRPRSTLRSASSSADTRSRLND